jgi:hypothetical protein
MNIGQKAAIAFIAGAALVHFYPEATLILVLGVIGNWLYTLIQKH